MMERKEIEQFLGDFVGVGVPHGIVPDKLFFYFGTLIDINNFEIKLELNHERGFKIIPINDILDIGRRTPK